MRGIACVRGGRLLFEALDLTLTEGAAAIVTGPNGAGKSSLLRIAGGLLRPDAGTVQRGSVAIADEALALDRRQTLGSALRFWAGLDGGDAEAAMRVMDLAGLADVPVHMLSTGQRRRAGLARVIAGGAALWLLDEPVNGLDGGSIALLDAAVARHRRGGGAVLAASHQMLPISDAQAVVLGR